MVPVANVSGNGSRTSARSPVAGYLSVVLLIIAGWMPATGFLVPGGTPRSWGATARQQTSHSNRPASLLPVRRSARFLASSDGSTIETSSLGCSLMAPDEQEERKRLFELQRGKAVDTLLTDYPTITTKQCDFSIFDQQIVLSDAQGFQVEGIRAYRTFFSVVPTLVNVCFSKVQVSAMLMDKHGIDKSRIRIRWRLDLTPRFSGASFGDVFRWLDSNGDGVISSDEYFNSQSRVIRQNSGSRSQPLVVEGISAYSLNDKGFITQHTIEVTSPTSISPLAYLRELLPVRSSPGMVSYPTPMFQPAVPLVAASEAVAGSGQAHALAPTVMASRDGSEGLAETPGAKGASAGSGRLGGGLKLPKQCKSDYDCNPGGYNFPLKCVDFIVTRLCVDNDDWKGGGLGALNWGLRDLIPEPIPVRIEDGWTRRYPPPDRSD